MGYRVEAWYEGQGGNGVQAGDGSSRQDVDDGRAELKALLKHTKWIQLQSKALLQPGPLLAEGIAELQRAIYPSRPAGE